MRTIRILFSLVIVISLAVGPHTTHASVAPREKAQPQVVPQTQSSPSGIFLPWC